MKQHRCPKCMVFEVILLAVFILGFGYLSYKLAHPPTLTVTVQTTTETLNDNR